MYHTGIPLGLFLNFLMMLSTWYACNLYLSCIDIVPIHVESLYEIGFVVMGRASIFIIATILMIGSVGLIMIYFIVFGDATSSIVRSIFFNNLTPED